MTLTDPNHQNTHADHPHDHKPNERRYCMTSPELALTDEIIIKHIEPNSRVIDLGCGDGRLLAKLRKQSNCSVMGIELEEKGILETISNGVPVIQANLDHGIPEISSASFDWAVMSQTLQQVRHPKFALQEMIRIAHRMIVVVPNFGFWRVRLQVLWQGRAPVTETLPYSWYNTPNLHLMSISDFRYLTVGQLNCRIVKEIPIINGKAVERAWASNLRAESVVYILESPQS
ncbi:MAG: methionine biosynthesis protein MetW [Planctomycetaceae bacterium]